METIDRPPADENSVMLTSAIAMAGPGQAVEAPCDIRD
jgi:hypothetical protein